MGPGNKDQVDELLNHLSIEANNPAVCMGQVSAICRSSTGCWPDRARLVFALHGVNDQAMTIPFCVVQDTCRQFASETSGKKKYDLFMQVCPTRNSWAESALSRSSPKGFQPVD